MERYRVENLYIANGLADYRLKNTTDLLKTHGINYKAVKGYKKLDDINKKIYERFIINFYNSFGIDSRKTLTPRGIYLVEETELFIIEKDGKGEYQVAVGGTVSSVDRTGKKVLLHSWEDEEYKRNKKIKSKSITYLRFEYKHRGRNKWLHVADENTWY